MPRRESSKVSASEKMLLLFRMCGCTSTHAMMPWNIRSTKDRWDDEEHPVFVCDSAGLMKVAWLLSNNTDMGECLGSDKGVIVIVTVNVIVIRSRSLGE